MLLLLVTVVVSILIDLLLLLLLLGHHGVASKTGSFMVIPGEDPIGSISEIIRTDISITW